MSETLSELRISVFILRRSHQFHYKTAIVLSEPGIRDSGFQRKRLGYSKGLETHKAAVALHFGIYNFVRVHKTVGTTPAVAAGVELERWSSERVVDMTRDYLRTNEDAEFEKAFAAAGM